MNDDEGLIMWNGQGFKAFSRDLVNDHKGYTTVLRISIDCVSFGQLKKNKI